MEQIFQAINVYFAFVAVLINTIFVILVLVRTARTTLYITFLFLCLAAIIWNFGIFMTYFSGRGFWFYFALIGAPLMPAFSFHCAHSLIKPGAKNNWIVLAYTLAGLLSTSSFLAIFHPGVKQFVDGVFWNIYFLVLLLPFVLGAMYMLQQAIRHTPSSEQKNRLSYFLWAIIIGILMALTELIQIFHIPVPMLGHPGSVLYSSVIAIGIFKHRQAYDMLAQMRLKLEFLSEMAAGIAHEVRNPLSSIKGAGSLLSAKIKPQDVPEVREYLDIIMEELGRLDHILINFQNLTRPLHVTKEFLSVSDIIRKTVQLADVGALPITITANLAADLPAVHADAASLKQVFLNLIKNAAEACGAKGALVITADAVPLWVRITFLDNGCGFPPENMAHIFEPFFTTKASGMGMGLAISQRIIQAHNGRIEAHNAVPRGAELSVFLPA